MFDNELYNRKLSYRNAMALAQNMLDNGLIDSKDYAEIDTIMAEKYALTSSTLFFREPLNNRGIRGNISYTKEEV